jgi:3-phosphoshikimate 1-carboxyvinyltransferase
LRSCTVSIAESSQFASALLLSAKHGGWNVKVADDDAEEAPYVTMTEQLVDVFPWKGGRFQIEPDASSGSYFWAAECMSPEVSRGMVNRSGISVAAWPRSRWQIDAAFFLVLFIKKSSQISRRSDLGDSIMTAIAIAPTFRSVMKFTDLGRLRVQECERVLALRTELTRCGAKVVEKSDTLTVFPIKPGELHGAEIETYNDHRMAMCFAILGLKVPGIKLQNPACVKKTFPNFFQKLATPPPNGLGVEIRDGHTGRKLEMAELFAD